MNTLFDILIIPVLAIHSILWVIFSFNLRSRPYWPKSENIKATLIICARNEAENLSNNLPHFFLQNDIRLEIIVVNDGSTDHTESILNQLSRQYPQLRMITISDKKQQGKKDALLAGILSASHDIILLADADCRPTSPYWALYMSEPVLQGYSIVTGYSPFIEENNSINSYARFENVMTALQYIGCGRMGLPYMGVGRNLAYNKEAIREVGFFSSHQDRISGDDDLTVQSILRKKGRKSIYFQTSPQSFMLSSGPQNAIHYIAQKTRHYSVSADYPRVVKILLISFNLSRVLLLTQLLAGLFSGYYMTVLICAAVHFGLSLVGRRIISQQLHQSFPVFQWILFDVLYPYITLILTIFGLLKKQKNWKSF
ncbi:MAG: glycosyltransferase [Saprospiraceae bacterium]|nr:glycosyltransferase [Saprospiraceae bacterium]